MNLGHSATITYKLKENAEKPKETKTPVIFNRNIDCFTQDMKKHISEKLKDLMHIFEYCDEGTDLSVTDEIL